jgi:MOSC domain-containing protein YiiM
MNGTVEWISVRPEPKAAVRPVQDVFADVSTGLEGDHDTKPHRQVTLISREALEGVARALNRSSVDPAATRRNILISGFDLNLDEGTQIAVGGALLEITGPCLPCSRMDENLGDGGRAAMKDAGGLTARILRSGLIRVGDPVSPELHPEGDRDINS